jgi:hypothetical protein
MHFHLLIKTQPYWSWSSAAERRLPCRLELLRWNSLGMDTPI